MLAVLEGLNSMEDGSALKVKFVTDDGVGGSYDKNITGDNRFGAAAVGIFGADDVFPVLHDDVFSSALADGVGFEGRVDYLVKGPGIAETGAASIFGEVEKARDEILCLFREFHLNKEILVFWGYFNKKGFSEI